MKPQDKLLEIKIVAPSARFWFRFAFAQSSGPRLRSTQALFALILLAAIGITAMRSLAVKGQIDASGQAEDRNVLIIIADDLGVDIMADYGVGNAPANTPNLDTLAKEGVLFEQAWAYPICTPFRAAALTGRFGFRTGVGTVGGRNAASLPQAEDIIPEILDAHPELGVAHAAIGKWHLGGGINGPTDHGFGTFVGALSVVEDYFGWQRVENGSASLETGYATSVQVDDASTWIAAQDQDPWFMWLAFNTPHSPFHRPPDDLHSVNLPPGDPPDRGGNVTPYYLAAVEAMDHEIGRLLAEMDPDVRARTTIIFMGDNGTPARTVSAPFARETSKGSLSQGGIWTPLLVAGAGITDPGRRVEHLVHSVDLMATSLDLLGMSPDDLPNNIDGQSLRPYLELPGQPALRDWAFSEQFGRQPTTDREGKAIRDLRYKYIRYDNGAEALFDLLNDPYEMRELLAVGPSADEAAALDSLRARLDALLAGPPVTATMAATQETRATNTPASTSTSTPTPTEVAGSTSTPTSSPSEPPPEPSSSATEGVPVPENGIYLPLLHGAGV